MSEATVWRRGATWAGRGRACAERGVGWRVIGRSALVCAVLWATASGGSAWAQLQVGLNFAGASFNKPYIRGSFAPAPNTGAAVGPNHVMALANGRVLVFDKTSGSVVRNQTLIKFWQGLNVNPQQTTYDPRLVYDSYSGRWFASSLENPSQPNRFLLAVSKTSDPTRGWTGFGLGTDPTAQYTADYDRLGVDSEGVYLVTNMFSVPGTPAQPPTQTVVVVPKADLLKANPTVARATTFPTIPYTDTNNPPLFVGAGASPVVNMDNTGMPTYLVSDTAVGTGTIRINSITGTAANPTLNLNGSFLTSNAYDSPVPAWQPNDPNGQNMIDVGEESFRAPVVQVDGKLWAAHTVAYQGRNAIHWMQLDPVSNTVLQQGLLSDPSLSYYFPSIAVNSFGDVVIGGNGSSQTQYVSSYAFLGRTNGGVTTFSPAQLLKAGTASFDRASSPTAETWGSQSATVVDPSNPGVFWTFQEVATSRTNWTVQITQLLVPGRALLTQGLAAAAVPEPGTWALGIAGLGCLAWWRRRAMQRQA